MGTITNNKTDEEWNRI